MKRISALAAAAILGLSAAACTPQNEAPSTQPAESSPASETVSAESEAGDVVELQNAVVREKGTDNDMTAIFGELVNTTDDDVTVTGFATSLGDANYEMHETVDGTMSEMDSPLVIPAGGTHALEPGGDHFMIMGYAEAIPAGDTVDITLELDGGQTVEIPSVPVRTMGAGDEEYGEDGELSGHSADHSMHHGSH